MKKNKCISLVFFFLWLGFTGHAQDFSFSPSREVKFAEYLIAREDYQDAIRVLEKTPFLPHLEDSLYYLKGWAFYHQKKLIPSARCLQKVSQNSPLYHKSIFFAGYNLAHSGKLEEAGNTLTSIFFPENESYLKELQEFELAGLALLQRDLQKYKKHQKAFSYEYYAVAEQEKKLDIYFTEINRYKRKSPLLAGILSAMVPGAGKIYAGKTGEGIATFFMTSAMGAVTLENYLKNGWINPKTLVFGSLFTIFYAGNIWGSVFSIKIAEEEFNEFTNRKILFDLHIPLRTVFN